MYLTITHTVLRETETKTSIVPYMVNRSLSRLSSDKTKVLSLAVWRMFRSIVAKNITSHCGNRSNEWIHNLPRSRHLCFRSSITSYRRILADTIYAFIKLEFRVDHRRLPSLIRHLFSFPLRWSCPQTTLGVLFDCSMCGTVSWTVYLCKLRINVFSLCLFNRIKEFRIWFGCLGVGSQDVRHLKTETWISTLEISA